VTRPDPSNALEKVEKFVSEKGEVMGYRVAFDGDGKTFDAYMKASGSRGIPTAFVVDKSGKLAWIGHPMRMDGPLAEIVEGTFDVELAAPSSARGQRRSLDGGRQDRARPSRHGGAGGARPGRPLAPEASPPAHHRPFEGQGV